MYGRMEEADTLIENLIQDKVRWYFLYIIQSYVFRIFSHKLQLEHISSCIGKRSNYSQN